MKSIDEIVALNVHMRIEDLNLEQKKVAILAGITPAYLNKLIKKKKSISRSTALPAIAKALFLDEIELFQDPARAAQWQAKEAAAASAYADLKKFNRTLAENLSETIAELKAERQKYQSFKGDLQKAWSLWPSAGRPLQCAALYLLGDDSQLDKFQGKAHEVLRALRKSISKNPPKASHEET